MEQYRHKCIGRLHEKPIGRQDCIDISSRYRGLGLGALSMGAKNRPKFFWLTESFQDDAKYLFGELLYTLWAIKNETRLLL